MVESVGLAVLAFLPHPPLAGLYILAIAGGILLAFDNPMRRSFVSEMVAPDAIPNAVVLYSTVVNISRVFGPGIGGTLIVTLGYGWCFAIDAASYIAVLICLFMMRDPELYRRPPQPRHGGEVREGLRYVRETPTLWVSFIMLAAIGTLAYNFNVTLPLFVTDSLGHSATVFTVLYSVLSAGAVVSGLLVAHRGLVHMRHIIAGAIAMGVSLLLLAAVPTVALAIPVVFLVGMASILYLTPTTAIVQVEGTPRDARPGPRTANGPDCRDDTPWRALAGMARRYRRGRAPLVLGGVACLGAATFGVVARRRALRSVTALRAVTDRTTARSRSSARVS